MRVKKLWFVYLLLAVILAVFITVIKSGENVVKYSDIIVPEDTIAVDVPEGKPIKNSSGASSDSSENSTASTSVAADEMEATTLPAETPEAGNITASAETPAPKEEVEAKPDPVESTPTPMPKNVVPDVVDDKVNTIAKKDVQVEDYLEIIQVLTGKLSLKEIKYLFDSASDDYWVKTSVEDIEKAREILFSKLSEDDLDKLNQLGHEYGRSMTILDKDIDVATVKEGQMRSLGLIE